MPARVPKLGQLRVGMSGWTYAPWRGTFYPAKLTHKNELAYASAQLNSIEVNGTFYGLLKPSSFAAWYEQTPADFVFSMKAPKFITHIRRLREVEVPIANFLLSGPLRLNEKLGPILWQLPPTLKFDAELIETFLKLLPKTTAAAAKLLKKCEPRMKGRTWSEIDADRPLRHAVEVRHETFDDAKFVKLLRNYNVALVCADTGGRWPELSDVTADFVYARLHGADELYVSGYTDAALGEWAVKIRAWSTGRDAPNGKRVGPVAAKRAKRDVYVYFDNTLKARTPFNAARLAMKLGLRDEPLAEAGESEE